jgi:hypothetical protein
MFKPSKTSRLFYTGGNDPRPGEEGTVSTVSLGRCRSHHMPGPGGGLVYVDWDESKFSGVFLRDLEKA